MSLAIRLERIEARRGTRTSDRDRLLQKLTYQMLEHMRGNAPRPEIPKRFLLGVPTISNAAELRAKMRKSVEGPDTVAIAATVAVANGPEPAKVVIDRLRPYRQDSGVTLDYL
jgi:hypothetical protein